MLDIKITTNINFKEKAPVTKNGELVASLVLGTGQAIGLEFYSDKVDSTTWSVDVKIVNPSDRNFVLKDIQIFWKGKYPLIAKSKFPSIEKAENGEGVSDSFLPMILESGRTKVFKVRVMMEFFSHPIPFVYIKKYFLKENIIEPDSYFDLARSFEIVLKTDSKDLILK